MLNAKCPFCQHPEMPEPPKNARPYAACPKCGKRSRAALSFTIDGDILVSYVSAAYKKEELGAAVNFRPTFEQEIFLETRSNASETIRDALDLYIKQYAPSPTPPGE